MECCTEYGTVLYDLQYRTLFPRSKRMTPVDYRCTYCTCTVRFSWCDLATCTLLYSLLYLEWSTPSTLDYSSLVFRSVHYEWYASRNCLDGDSVTDYEQVLPGFWLLAKTILLYAYSSPRLESSRYCPTVVQWSKFSRRKAAGSQQESVIESPEVNR